MSSKEQQVIAAVPTYNMAESLSGLVPQLLEQRFDSIFILDDASTDDTTSVIEQFGREVQLIPGDKNVGAAANRNRIINILRKLDKPDVIINFIEADASVEPQDKPLADAARDLFSQYPDAGMIGGKILNADGSWGAFNYGPPFSAKYLLATTYQLRIEAMSKTDPEKAKALYRQHADLLKGYPDIFESPKATKVGWLAEGFTFIRAQTFMELGGYNPKLDYLEALDFGAKLRSKGLESVFDPSAVLRHLQVDVRGNKKYTSVLKALAHLTAQRTFRK